MNNPLIYERILYQSRLSPASTAVSSAGREVTYAKFVVHIEQATHYLHQQSLPDSGLVAVMIADDYVHWLAVLALARLGLVSVSIPHSQHEVLSSVNASLILTDQDSNASGPYVFLKISTESIASLANDPGALRDLVCPNADAPLRVMLSSGTTGVSKKILLTHGLLQNRLKNIIFTYDISSATRYLDAVPITTICGFHLPLATWSVGGTVIMHPQQFDKYKTILRNRINLMFASPIVLVRLLETIPHNALPIQGLKIFVGGSVLPRVVNLQTRLRLTSALFIIYGSTEASVTTYAHASIADNHANACGHVLPFVEVQAVDASGKPVATGEVGEIRIRGEGCVSGYLDEPTLNPEIFRDGWFYPGDTGFLNASGMLHLVGRTGDLMNLGGFKISPDLIEQTLRDCSGVADIAAFAMEDSNGISIPWLSIVTKDGYQQKELVAKYSEKFPNLPPVHIALVTEIPRNEMGKIQRKLLSNMGQVKH